MDTLLIISRVESKRCATMFCPFCKSYISEAGIDIPEYMDDNFSGWCIKCDLIMVCVCPQTICGGLKDLMKDECLKRINVLNVENYCNDKNFDFECIDDLYNNYYFKTYLVQLTHIRRFNDTVYTKLIKPVYRLKYVTKDIKGKNINTEYENECLFYKANCSKCHKKFESCVFLE